MKKKNVSMKAVVLLLAIIMLVGCVAGGTLAYLMVKTKPVQNTFSSSNIDITLDETVPTDKTAKMVPGLEIPKDPKVTVLANSEACYLFVKVDAVNGVALKNDTGTYDASTYLTYAMGDGWIELDATKYPGVYYRLVASSTADQGFPVLAGKGDGELKDGFVTVLTTVTKDMMEAIEANSSLKPTLTFTAYAIQQLGFNTPEAAWIEAKNLG